MRSLDTKHFGTVTLESGDDTFVTHEVTVAGRTAPCSLFLAMGLGAERLAKVKALLDDLETLDQRARATLRQELAADAHGTVAEFVAFHLEEVPEAMAHLLEGQAVTPAALLEHAKLCTVAAHLEPDGFAIVLDYAPARELTDQLLAVRFDPTGTIVQVSHES